MSLIKSVVHDIFTKGGYVKVAAAVLIASSFGIGIYFKFFSHSIDSPAEQVAEIILVAYGVDVDFSEDKKSSGDE